MHDEFPHWNSLGPQEDGAHSTSSEPSPQSSSPLHTKFLEMQRLLAHVNSFGAQVMLPRGRRKKNYNAKSSHLRMCSLSLHYLGAFIIVQNPKINTLTIFDFILEKCYTKNFNSKQVYHVSA